GCGRRRPRRGRVARGRVVRGHLPSRYPLVALVILDGWGCAPPGPGNAVELADTPVFDELWRRYPHETLNASGEAAGLPPGQMGNSEDGHLTIGAGRRLYQDLMRVNKAIEDGSFFENPALLAAIVNGEGDHADDPIDAIRRSYERGITDEFVEPVVLDGRPRLEPGDTAIFFNFRPDRARQLTQLLLEAGFDVTTMTRYRDDLDCPVAVEEREVPETLAEVLAANGVRQLHVAETEKYAHVTYFLNGGREEEWPGETRILVPSPRDVPSYDRKPEMSAREVTERFCSEIGSGYGFGIVNFA